MSGLKRRLTRRRSAGPEGSEPTAAAPGPGTTPNQPPAEEAPTSLLADPAAQTPVQPAPFSAGQPVPGAPYSHADPSQPPAPPIADLPPGLDPDELAAVPISSARRGRLRKRVAFLRAARELLLRDLGGFVYEIHRTAGDHEHEAHRQLRATKLDRLSRVDAELHELELRLDDVRRNVVVSEPGVGGECPECGELFGSAAHYCSHCGLPLTESARRAFSRIVAAQPPAVEAPQPAAPAAAAPDQPTQELPGLTAQPETVFHWPPREEKPAGERASETAATAPGPDDATADATDATAEADDDATPADDASAEPDHDATPATHATAEPDHDATPATHATAEADDDATPAADATTEADDPPPAAESANGSHPAEDRVSPTERGT